MTATPSAVIRPKFGKSKLDIVGKLGKVPAPITIFPVKAPAKKRPGPAAIPLQTRIDRLTDKSRGPNGVWLWLGSRSQSNGYPQIGYRDPSTGKKVTKQVHRVLMELKLGRTLDRDEYVLHDRGSPKMDVNPKHLRIGSQQENMDDAKADGRITRNRLDVAAVMEIDMLFHRKGASIQALAHRFGVSHQCIVNVTTGKTHSKITGRVYAPGKPGRRPKLKLVVGKPSRTSVDTPRGAVI